VLLVLLLPLLLTATFLVTNVPWRN